MKQFAEQENITEELKATNQMEWVCRMNNIKKRAVNCKSKMDQFIIRFLTYN